MNITLKQTDHTGDSAVFEVPEGFEAIVDGDKVILKLKHKKDLRWWWRRYATLEPPAINRLLKSDEYKYAPWWLLMDFYRWMADQMD
ncbi:MAG: hypothetical protein KKD18_00025, partial [Nanoarchaeota archaeon]|nr:hypothetical protein [Nanoarchaeota archaeon]